MIVIVFGVSGSGKTTIGQLLAESLNLHFYDADDFHPEANVQKMASGNPLNDKDRNPWLETLAEAMKEWEKAGGAVLACSALKESYRQMLETGSDDVKWVYLLGSFDQIKQRMEARQGHYMKADMLRSQFEALEEPAYGIHVDISLKPEEMIQVISTRLKE
ncbi:MAG: gluconokinase [Bacteroidetes bacterium]|nr:MAG: gluconokinase [Bacteroidota bacterium]